MSDDFAQATEIIPGRFYFTCLKRSDSLKASHIASTSICYSIDDELLFEPFFADFGPLNLGKAYRYCRKTQELLQEADRTKKRLYHYCGPHAHHKANAAVLVGIFQVLYLNRTADDAFKPLNAFKPYVPFRDASCGVSTFHLTVLHCLKGIQKARDVGFIDWNSGNSTWSLDEYEQYEQVENGDLNWIMPGKLLAFSGPASRSNEIVGYRLFTPEDYWDYFKKRNVTAVVRLNKKIYDRRRFTDGGIRHYELYFPDGSCPSEAIILKFLEIAENEPGGLAIHCKAGLGRTGVLICAYLMKHFRFTAEECIGYIRIARPGSVIGPQQNFLCDIEARMWQEGDMHRQRRGSSAAAGSGGAGLGAGDLAVSGRPVAMSDLHEAHAGQYAMAGAAYRNMQQSPYAIRSHIVSAPIPSNPADMALLQYKSKPVGSAGARIGTASNYSVGYARSGSAVGASHGGGGSGGGGDSDVTRSTSSLPTRAPSTDRAFERVAGGAAPPSSLRSTLHTETLRGAERPRTLVERNLQSADVSRGGWRGAGGTPSSAPRTPSAAASPSAAAGFMGHQRSGVARTLAPNGQPRKVPVAMLQQYHAGLSGGLSGRSSAPNLQAMAAAEASGMKAGVHLRYGLNK